MNSQTVNLKVAEDPHRVMLVQEERLVCLQLSTQNQCKLLEERFVDAWAFESVATVFLSQTPRSFAFIGWWLLY